MNEIELPKNSCPLCKIKNIKSIPIENNHARMYYCPNCGHYGIAYGAYRFTPIFTDPEVRAKLSYVLRHRSNENDPLILRQENYEDILKSVSLPSPSEQLDKFLIWFGEQSKYSLDNVDGNTKHLIANIGCKNHSQIIYLLDQLWSDGYINMEVPTTRPLRDKGTFDLFVGHLTRKGLEKIEEIKKPNRVSPNFSQLDVLELLEGKESTLVEIKGSFQLALDRLLKGDRKKELKKEVAKTGFLKSIVGLLNSKGGNILIGAIEKSKYNINHLENIDYKKIDSYYVIGVEIEEEDEDKYELCMRNLISSSISKDLVELVDISFPIYENYKLCLIRIGATSQKWYYLDKHIFYVREGNRTVKLDGVDADDYKRRNPR